MQKTVYWDLINSDMNRRDVQTGCSGYVHKNTGDESMDVFQGVKSINQSIKWFESKFYE